MQYYSAFFSSIMTSAGSASEHAASTALSIAVGTGHAAWLRTACASVKTEEVPNGEKIAFIASTVCIFSDSFITAGHSDSMDTEVFIISGDSAFIIVFSPHTPGLTSATITLFSLYMEIAIKRIICKGRAVKSRYYSNKVQFLSDTAVINGILRLASYNV